MASTRQRTNKAAAGAAAEVTLDAPSVLDQAIANTKPRVFPELSLDKLAGMVKEVLPAGVIRRIHVIPSAIGENTKGRKEVYKTIMVHTKLKDNGGCNCTSCGWRTMTVDAVQVVNGETLLRYEHDYGKNGEHHSPVYLETNGEVILYHKKGTEILMRTAGCAGQRPDEGNQTGR